jgi:transcriptional regulator with XRE-family HTH domain
MIDETSTQPLYNCDRAAQPRDSALITSFQMRAARALLGIDQRTLAEMSGVSVPTIQRMEASAGNVRGIVDSLTRVVDALNRAGVELIGEHARSDDGGRGVRLKQPGPPPPLAPSA